jgi:hypothetical protein
MNNEFERARKEAVMAQFECRHAISKSAWRGLVENMKRILNEGPSKYELGVPIV